MFAKEKIDLLTEWKELFIPNGKFGIKGHGRFLLAFFGLSA
jgi:hypothetical protein